MLPTDLTDLSQVGLVLFDAVQNKQWGLLVSFGIAVLIALARKYIPETNPIGKFISTKFGAIISNFTLSLSGAFATMFVAQQPFDVSMIKTAVAIALSASGGWAIYKNLKEAWEEMQTAKTVEKVVEKPLDTLNK